jgi:hypothetical protein
LFLRTAPPSGGRLYFVRRATSSIKKRHPDRYRGLGDIAATRRGLNVTRDGEPVRPVAIRLGQALRHEFAHVGERHHVGDDEGSRQLPRIVGASFAA